MTCYHVVGVAPEKGKIQSLICLHRNGELYSHSLGYVAQGIECKRARYLVYKNGTRPVEVQVSFSTSPDGVSENNLGTLPRF